MALIERLMHHESEPRERYIPVHAFFAACTEVIYGALTPAQVQAALSMTTADLVDWNALAALFPTGTAALSVAQKALYLNRLHGVFILAEKRYAGYSTPAEVRAKLGI